MKNHRNVCSVLLLVCERRWIRPFSIWQSFTSFACWFLFSTPWHTLRPYFIYTITIRWHFFISVLSIPRNSVHQKMSFVFLITTGELCDDSSSPLPTKKLCTSSAPFSTISFSFCILLNFYKCTQWTITFACVA